MIDVPQHHHKPERGRLTALARRADNDDLYDLLAIQTSDGSWQVYGLGAVGVCLTNEAMVSFAEASKAVCLDLAPLPRPPAGRWLSSGPATAPGGRSAPHRPLRWAHCPDDGCLHLLGPGDVAAVATGVAPRRSAVKRLAR